MGTRYDIVLESPGSSIEAVMKKLRDDAGSANVRVSNHDDSSFVIDDVVFTVSNGHPWVDDPGPPFPEMTHTATALVKLRDDNRETRMTIAKIAGVLAQHFSTAIVYNMETTIATSSSDGAAHTFDETPYVADYLAERGELEFAIAIDDNAVPTDGALLTETNGEILQEDEQLIEGSELSEMMHSLSDLFVQSVHAASGRSLDYTSADVLSLDDLIDEAWQEPFDDARASDLAQSLGAYVGEVVIKEVGGSWIRDAETFEAALDMEAFTAYPLSKAYKRLIAGRAEGISEFYESLWRFVHEARAND